ncbi:hypothetical protein FKM82_007592 [Ascaphus truei]
MPRWASPACFPLHQRADGKWRHSQRQHGMPVIVCMEIAEGSKWKKLLQYVLLVTRRSNDAHTCSQHLQALTGGRLVIVVSFKWLEISIDASKQKIDISVTERLQIHISVAQTFLFCRISCHVHNNHHNKV